MKRISSTLLILLVAFGLLWPAPAQATFAVPIGFTESLVVDGLGVPNAFDWLPNGDILIASQNGIVQRWPGAGAAQPVLDISGAVCFLGEMGLLGLAVDPVFNAGQRFVYLYYTHKRGPNCNESADRANRVSRFTADANFLLGNEQVLIDNVPAFNGNHNGGDLHFGKDGLLYISVGDSGRDLQTGAFEPNNGNAYRLDLLNGKILRIARDGGIPPSNPFANGVSCAATGMAPGAPVGATQAAKQKAKPRNAPKKKKHKKNHRGKGGKKHNKHHNRNKRHKRPPRRNPPNPPTPSSGNCQEIFAFGLRNPFRFTFDSDDNAGPQRFYINDVGGGAWEEIDSGAPGADYGWNVREGPCPVTVVQANCAPDPRFVSPVFAYSRSGLPDNLSADFTGCRTITGGAFVPSSANWPALYNGYLFTDLACGKLFALTGEGGSAAVSELGTGAANLDAAHLGFGPDGALYYTTFQGGGQLRKIVHS